VADRGILAKLFKKFLLKGDSDGFVLPGTLSDESRILAIDTGDLSEFLFYLPLLQAIRSRYPRAQIDILAPEEHESLVAPSGLARNCLLFNSKQLRPWSPGLYSLVKDIRSRSYDISIVMSFNPSPSLESVALLSGARLRMGPSHNSSSPAINFEIKSRSGDKRYRGTRLHAAAPFLDLPNLKGPCRFPLPEEKLKKMGQKIHFIKPRVNDLLIGVDPALGKSGVGFSAQNLHFVINQISSQLSCRTIPVSLSSDEERLSRFESGLNVPPLSLPKDSLFDVVQLVAHCDLFISGNTDLFHYAAALEVPTIGLFMEEDTSIWEPSDSRHVCILRILKGQRVEIDTLMAAIADVRSV
jgi:heptosyltransferase I